MIKENNHYVSSYFHDFSHFEHKKKNDLDYRGKEKISFCYEIIRNKKKIEGNSTHVYLK